MSCTTSKVDNAKLPIKGPLPPIKPALIAFPDRSS
jgi:hypothetical protein